MRFSLCFVLGFLLGFSPFFHLEGIRPVDPSSIDIGSPFPFRRNADSSSGDADRNPGTTMQRDLLGKGVPDIVKQSYPADEATETSGGRIVGIGLGAKTKEVEESLQSPGNLLIVVTPTYNRAFQALYLTRLGQTLRLVRPPLLWIVVEMDKGSAETAELLRTTGVMYRHLVAAKNLSDIKDRGVHQRNTALEHIERHHLDGIVYFADDDNIYTTELFEHIREIR